MKGAKKTRKFNGKVYHLHDWYFDKRGALVAKSALTLKGHSVRVTVRQMFPGGPRYLVWKTKIGKPPKPGTKGKVWW